MLKRILLVFIVAVSAILLVACGERTYAADGVYTAFRWETHTNGAQQVTTVSVTIENDKITKFYIDCLQGHKVVENEGEENETVSYQFNEKTKKELKYGYGMHKPASQTDTEEAYKKWLKDNNKLEWFEQAELIEKFFLENGPDAIKTDSDKYITNIEGGVTIKDGGYSELAKEAIELAKEGKAQAWVNTTDAVVFVTAKVDKNGKFTELKLDTIQGKVVDGKWAWNEKTKQELGNDYAMKGIGPKYEFKDGEWKVVADAKSELEWFEQANLITEYVLENGISGIKSIEERGISKDGKTLAIAGVTVKTDSYIEVLKALYKNFE